MEGLILFYKIAHLVMIYLHLDTFMDEYRKNKFANVSSPFFYTFRLAWPHLCMVLFLILSYYSSPFF